MEAAARQRAVVKISEMMQEGGDIARIASTRVEVTRKLNAVNSEINTLVAKSDARAQMVVNQVRGLQDGQPELRRGMMELKHSVKQGNFWRRDRRSKDIPTYQKP
jgi:hypothetical protein